MIQITIRRWHLIGLLLLTACAVVLDAQIRSGDFFRLNTGETMRKCATNPEGVLTAPAGSFCFGASGLYWKSSGSGNTGWLGPAGTSSSSGDVTAASSFGADNRVVRSDGTGKGVQVSGWAIDDSDNGTGVKIDAEGTGNTLTIPSVHFYPWVGCQAGTASLLFNYLTGTAPTGGCEGTNVANGYATFPDAAGSYGAVFFLPLAADWTGTMDVSGWARTTGTGNVVIQFEWACTASAASATDAWQTAVDTGAVAVGSSGQYFAWSKTGISVTTGSAGRGCKLHVFRDRAHGSDTLNAAFDMVETVAVILRRAL